MRHLILAAIILSPAVANAQLAQPTQDQVTQGFREEILARFQDAANLRAQLIVAQARVAALEAAAKPTAAPAAPANTTPLSAPAP